MKKYFKLATIVACMMFSFSALAQDAKKMVDVKALTYEQAIENKEIAGALIFSKKDAEFTQEELNDINVEIYRRGYGHHLTKEELKAIDKRVKALRVKLIEK